MVDLTFYQTGQSVTNILVDRGGFFNSYRFLMLHHNQIFLFGLLRLLRLLCLHFETRFLELGSQVEEVVLCPAFLVHEALVDVVGFEPGGWLELGVESEVFHARVHMNADSAGVVFCVWRRVLGRVGAEEYSLGKNQAFSSKRI